MPATGIPVTTCDRNEDSSIRVSGYLSPERERQAGTPVKATLADPKSCPDTGDHPRQWRFIATRRDNR
jgi:hypothetical protein